MTFLKTLIGYHLGTEMIINDARVNLKLKQNQIF